MYSKVFLLHRWSEHFWPLFWFLANSLNKQSSYEMVAITHFDCPSVAQLPVDLKSSSTSSGTSTLILISRFVIETDNCAPLHRISSHGNQRTFFIMGCPHFLITSCSFLTEAIIQGTDKTLASIKAKAQKIVCCLLKIRPVPVGLVKWKTDKINWTVSKDLERWGYILDHNQSTTIMAILCWFNAIQWAKVSSWVLA